ncbi:MAG: hypothetical protein ACFFE3_12700 [Candidatus Thorarchaeota archaeon]
MDLDHEGIQDSKRSSGIRVYGISGSTIKKEIENITGVNPGKNAVYSRETGRVSVTSEIYSSNALSGGGDCSGCGGSGDCGEGAIICLIVIGAIMIAITIVWAVVMFAFSIMTVGGFFRKRFRTLVVIEKENKEFLGKLAVMTVQKRGIMQYPIGHPQYDEWMNQVFKKFGRLKILRQISIFLGFCWGFIEVAFKLNELVFGVGGYDLWPLRYVMITVFLPLLLYSPILEIQFRGAFEKGDELVMRLVNEKPSYSPNQPMIFSETPIEVGRIAPNGTKKT